MKIIIIPAAVKNVTVKIITNHRYPISIYTHPVVIFKYHHQMLIGVNE